VVAAVVPDEPSVVVVDVVPQALSTSASTTNNTDHACSRFTVSPPFDESGPMCVGPVVEDGLGRGVSVSFCQKAMASSQSWSRTHPYPCGVP